MLEKVERASLVTVLNDVFDALLLHSESTFEVDVLSKPLVIDLNHAIRYRHR